MWRNSDKKPVGTDPVFEAAAARVTAEPVPGSDEEVSRNASQVAGAMSEEKMIIREEWAEGAARLCFLPAARLLHPAYALTDEEAESISPQMQAFLQAVADKYAPALLARLAGKYPEFFDLAAAVAVLHYQKWKLVSHIRAVEAQRMAAERQQPKEAAEAEAFARAAVDADVSSASRTVETDKPQAEGPRVI